MEEQQGYQNVGGSVAELTFNDGVTLSIRPDDIVVFVGPNNVGKSRALKDIYTLSGGKKGSIVVIDAKFNMKDGPIHDLLSKVAVGWKNGSYMQYQFLGKSFNISQNVKNFAGQNNFGDASDAFVLNLTTENRLLVCKPPEAVNRNEARPHPIHYALFDDDHRIWLKDNFEKAFGTEIIPDAYFGKTVPLRMGKGINIDQFTGDASSLAMKCGELLSHYPQIQDQGDGIRSFTGILLYLMMRHINIFLIDEPESFLHPPQARIMGRIIGGTIRSDQQAFISTHSEDIIQGLLSVCPERVKLIRITRSGNKNGFAFLENQKILDVWKDPLLKYSNILDSLFHNTVVLCESDSDCNLYSIVNDHIKEKEGTYSETLFIHCGGKHRMAKTAQALLALRVNVRLVADFDVLDSEQKVFREITDAFGIDWNTIQADYDKVVQAASTLKKAASTEEVRKEIVSILDNAAGETLTKSEVERVRNATKAVFPWSKLKSEGESGIPSDEGRNAFCALDGVLKTHGIHIVPIGELERFFPSVGGHGPVWVDRVLQSYPDMNDPAYDKIVDFVLSLNL